MFFGAESPTKETKIWTRYHYYRKGGPTDKIFGELFSEKDCFRSTQKCFQNMYLKVTVFRFPDNDQQIYFQLP